MNTTVHCEAQKNKIISSITSMFQEYTDNNGEIIAKIFILKNVYTKHNHTIR